MSGLLGGGGGGQSTVDPVIGALNVQTSTFGMAIPIAYGQNRLSANLIWYGDFTAIPHTTTQSSGGKGGGGASSSNTTFTYTTAIAMGLCEGTISGIGQVWADKTLTTLSALGLTLFTGTNPQTAWGYLTTNHAGQALGYSSLAYVATSAYALGGSANLPNHSFEILGVLNYNPATGVYGAKPDLLLTDYLTNVNYGVGFASASIASLTQYNAYCMAAGILLSPSYTQQAAANTHINDIMTATNSNILWSENTLKVLPYGDTAITGAWGVNYVPINNVQYDLNDDSFVGDSSQDPVIVTRKTQADAFNQVQVEYLDASNQYNVAIATASDLANIQLFGLRPQSPITLHGLTSLTMAQTVAQFILQRSLYIRNTYEFTLGLRYSMLEPMDIVTLTDAALGLNLYPVRITEIEETAGGLFKIVAEDFLAGVSHAGTYPSQTGAGYQANYNITSGGANAPVVFEPPTSLSVTPQIWLATSGGVNWGGCEVWISRDNTTYVQVGTINGECRHGVLSATLATHTDPDTTDTLAVNLSVSLGSLLGGTLADRDQMNTLCYVDGELISYQTAALTSAYNYNLTSMRRGAYGSAIAAHLSGTKFARLDQAIFKYNYDPAMIGSSIYIKLRSFNIYGLAREDLAGLTPITYAVAGSYLGAITGLALTQPFVGSSVKVGWNPYVGASSYRAEIWVSGVLKRQVNGIASTSYEYSYQDMVADGGPWRSIDVHVMAMSTNSTTLSAAVLTVTNPQLGAPAGLSATAGAGSIIVAMTKSTAVDFAGMLIFASTTSGFTPDVTTWTNLAMDTPNNSFTFTGLTSGVPVYYRVAMYDQYGKDSLTLSSEITATPLALGGVRIVSSIPSTTGATLGDAVSLTTNGKIYRFINTTNVAKATGATAWDSDAHSTASFASGAAVAFTVSQTNAAIIFGLDTNPTLDANYTSINFGLYCTAAGGVQVYENGTLVFTGGSYAANDLFEVVYVGSAISYYQNGAVIYTHAATAALTLFVDSSFYTVGGAVTNVRFGATRSSYAIAALVAGGLTCTVTTAGSWATWIDGTDILAATITAGSLAVGSVLAQNINVTTLSAVSAALGSISSGNITLGSTSWIQGGQSAYNTGIGFFLGYSGSAYQFSIGNPAGQYMTWDGSNLNLSALNITGALNAATGTFSGTLTAGAINAVNTINIAGNAVTLPAQAFTAATVSLGGWTTAQSLTVTKYGSSAFLLCGLDYAITSSASVTFDVLVDGAVVYTSVTYNNTGTGTINGSWSIGLQDLSGAGSHTYTLRASGSGNVSNRNIFFLETRR